MPDSDCEKYVRKYWVSIRPYEYELFDKIFLKNEGLIQIINGISVNKCKRKWLRSARRLEGVVNTSLLWLYINKDKQYIESDDLIVIRKWL